MFVFLVLLVKDSLCSNSFVNQPGSGPNEDSASSSSGNWGRKNREETWGKDTPQEKAPNNMQNNWWDDQWGNQWDNQWDEQQKQDKGWHPQQNWNGNEWGGQFKKHERWGKACETVYEYEEASFEEPAYRPKHSNLPRAFSAAWIPPHLGKCSPSTVPPGLPASCRSLVFSAGCKFYLIINN